MSTVMKCDRCGMVYENNTAFPDFYGYNDEVKLNGLTILVGNMIDNRKTFDLCDECLADLLNFVYGYSEYKLTSITISDQRNDKRA